MSQLQDDNDDGDEPKAPQPIRMPHMDVNRCYAARADAPDGPPIAVLELRRHGGQPQRPVMLELDEARKLLVLLLVAIAYHKDPHAKQVRRRFFPKDQWPEHEDQDVAPSIHPHVPARPITDRDVWMLTRLLRHVEDHETFMRFIGVPDHLIRKASVRPKRGKKASPKPKRRKRG